MSPPPPRNAEAKGASRRSVGLTPAHELVERALSTAPGGELAVVVDDAFLANVRFANNSTTTNGVTRARRVSVVAFEPRAGGRGVGVASASGEVEIERLVELARDKSKAAPLAEDDSPLVSGEEAADFAKDAEETAVSVFSNLVDELGEAFRRAETEHHLVSGFALHEVDTTYLGTSSGVRARHVSPSGTFELVARDRAGGSTWSGRSARDPSLVEVGPLHEQAIERLSFQSRRVELPPGRYEVILPADAVADLVIELAEAMGGRDAEDGSSVFSTSGGGTRLGELVSAKPVSLVSDPDLPGLSETPFVCTAASSSDVSVFDNGAAVPRTAWIEDGVVSHLRYHRAGARRAGVDFAPPGDNLAFFVPGATGGLSDLVASTRRGLLLTCLWYIREVDPATLLLTGLTRDGVYLVEDGEITGAVNNFRFNESPLSLLGRIVEVGEASPGLSREWGEWMRDTVMAPLRVAEFNMSSVSEAN